VKLELLLRRKKIQTFEAEVNRVYPAARLKGKIISKDGGRLCQTHVSSVRNKDVYSSFQSHTCKKKPELPDARLLLVITFLLSSNISV
jgi:hypothetical protein